MKESVAVIGAGTSGLIAARRLGELGVRATVYDQKKKPGYPVNASGILSISGLSTLGFDYSKAVTNTLHGARLHFGGQKVEIKSRKPIARVLDRLKLNEICYEKCEDSGSKVKVGTKVTENILDGLSRDSLIVGADGVVSTVAKHFRFPPIERHILTYRAEYEYDGFEDPGMVELFFDKGVFPGFFGWISPNAKDIAEVGIGIDSRYGNSKRTFEKFLKFREILEITGKGRLIDEGASIIPIGLRKRFADNKKGVLLVGDAAGQVKPTTGGGIIFGGNGAVSAAEVIKRHITAGEELERYEKLWRREFEKEISLHSFFYNIYASMDKRSLEGLAKIIRGMKLDRFLGEYGDMDRPSLIVKRFFLRGLAK